MGNKTSKKNYISSNKLLFEINADNSAKNRTVSMHVSSHNNLKTINLTPNKTPQLKQFDKIKKLDLQEIKSTYNFISKTLNINFQNEVNCGIIQNAMMSCDHQIVCEYEEDKKKKMVHFSDENKLTIMTIKKIQKLENKFLNNSIKIFKFFAENTEKEENSNQPKDNFMLNLQKQENIKPKNEKVKIKSEKVENILFNNFTTQTPLVKNQKNKCKDKENALNISKNSLTPTQTPRSNANPQKHQRNNSKKKIEPEKTSNLKNKIEEKIMKNNLLKNEEIIHKSSNKLKKEDKGLIANKPQKETKHIRETKLNETLSSAASLKINNKNKIKPTLNKNTRNLKLDLTNTNVLSFPRMEAPMSTKSYQETKQINFNKIKNNVSSRNSSVRSKENQPPMKSILKKKPKFTAEEQRNFEDDSDEMARTNRDSFQTVCITDLNESIGSKSQKSQKSQKFSSESENEEEEKSLKLKDNKPNNPFFNPLKIRLKLDDLLNSNDTKNKRNNIYTESFPLNTMNINIKTNEKNNYLKKNEYITTTDTSKEDQTKFNKFNKTNNNSQKIESLSSSSLSDYHKIEEIVHSNIDFQKGKNLKVLDKNVKHSINSSQFNHISEEASEFFKDEIE